MTNKNKIDLNKIAKMGMLEIQASLVAFDEMSKKLQTKIRNINIQKRKPSLMFIEKTAEGIMGMLSCFPEEGERNSIMRRLSMIEKRTKELKDFFKNQKVRKDE